MEQLHYTGLPAVPIDPRDAWKDLIVAGEINEAKDIDHSPKLRKEYQGYKPFCVSYSSTKVYDAIEKKDSSQDALALMTNTQSWGNYTNQVFIYMAEKGLVKQADFPDISLETWNTIQKLGNNIKDEVPADVYAKLIKPKKLGWMRLDTSKTILSSEVQTKPLLLVIPLGDSFNTKQEVVEPPKNVTYLHQTVLAGIKHGKGFKIHDSLRGPLGEGEYYLDWNYPIYSAYELTASMPFDWKETQQANLDKEFGLCLNHYGYPRDLSKEQFVAGEMVRAFKAFKNESVYQAAGKFWTVYVNAIAYGGYSLEYYRLGVKWTAGDVINDCYHWRRTGEHLFDFNKLR